jgi:hypothetical protein
MKFLIYINLKRRYLENPTLYSYFVDNLSSFIMALIGLPTKIFMHFLSVMNYKAFAAMSSEISYCLQGHDAV